MISTENFKRYAADAAEFRNDLLIEVGPGQVARLGDVMDPWQREDFAAADPGWRRCLGLPNSGTGKSRIYLERGRGHSKTSDLAVSNIYALVMAPRPVVGCAAASDRDQAGLLRSAIIRTIRLNPWLGEILEVQNYVIRNRAKGHPGFGSTLEILSSDEASSWGLLVDWIVADELSVWKGEGELWFSLASTAAKRKTSMLLVISNAGRNKGDAWQWDAREHARTSDAWYFRTLDGPVASWLSPADLEEQRRMLPATVYKRVWENRWVSGGDILSEESVTSCCVLMAPPDPDDSELQWVSGLDIGVKNDRSALVVLAADYKRNKVSLASVQSWAPGPTGQVNLADVRAAVIAAHRRYRKLRICFDPSQCLGLAQDAARVGAKMVEFPFTGANCNRIATAILEAFSSRRIELFPHPQLVKDLLRLEIEERSFGYKLTAARDSRGHADTAIALAIALPEALELAGKRKIEMVSAVSASDPDEDDDLPTWARADRAGAGRRMGGQWWRGAM